MEKGLSKDLNRITETEIHSRSEPIDSNPAAPTGKTQSPINIANVSSKRTISKNDFELNYKDSSLKLVNKGHTLEVPYEPGSTFTFAGKKYELQQFHFHGPSEHLFDGATLAMEVHLVHREVGGNELAVIGLLLREGAENPFLVKLWSQMPVLSGEVTVLNTHINVSQLLPADHNFFIYVGSLTTPPYTEGTRWFVLKNQMQVSKEQVKKFASYFGHNAREVQPLNGRLVTEVQILSQ